MKRSLEIALALIAVVPISDTAAAYHDANAGKPAARALPMYCQMGECAVVTVEATDPVAFAAKGVLFRVES